MDRNLIMELNLENSNVKKISIQGQKEKFKQILSTLII